MIIDGQIAYTGESIWPIVYPAISNVLVTGRIAVLGWMDRQLKSLPGSFYLPGTHQRRERDCDFDQLHLEASAQKMGWGSVFPSSGPKPTYRAQFGNGLNLINQATDYVITTLSNC